MTTHALPHSPAAVTSRRHQHADIGPLTERMLDEKFYLLAGHRPCLAFDGGRLRIPIDVLGAEALEAVRRAAVRHCLEALERDPDEASALVSVLQAVRTRAHRPDRSAA